jgi:tetratricopeptide (TPR) repeat protein
MSHWVTCIDIPYYLRITQLLPDSESSLNNLGAAYYLSGEVGRASQIWQQSLEINSTDAYALALLGHYQAAIGNRELALKYIARGQQAGPENMYVFYPSATALVILGQMEDALQSLERAVELGYPRQLVAMDAGFRDLSQMPEFQTLVKATDKKINE